MIGFNTVLPLSADTSVDRFLELCRQWQQGSPHRTLPLDSRPIHDGLRYDSDLDVRSMENNFAQLKKRLF